MFLLGLRQRGNPSVFASMVSNPSSRLYRHFLSLRQFRPTLAIGRTPAGGAAQPGYDLATGLGSLNAFGFAAAVASLRARGLAVSTR